VPRGRPRKPIEQALREGNPGKRQLPEPVRLRGGDPIKPPGLPDAASELWDEIVPALASAGVVDRVDTASLTALCLEWARAEEARQLIDEDGVLGVGSTGQLAAHPALAIERSAHLVFLKFAQEYGLTPAARARIAAAMAGAREVLERELAEVIDLTPELRLAEE
jgi:P27 family predicted phage terminase small subunit